MSTNRWCCNIPYRRELSTQHETAPRPKIRLSLPRGIWELWCIPLETTGLPMIKKRKENAILLMVQRRPIRRSLDSRCTHTSTVMWRFLLLEHKIECFLKSDTLVRRPMTFVNEKRQWLILTRVWCELFWCPTVPILLLLWCLCHLINVFTTFTTQYGHTSLGMCTLFVTLAAKQKHDICNRYHCIKDLGAVLPLNTLELKQAPLEVYKVQTARLSQGWCSTQLPQISRLQLDAADGCQCLRWTQCCQMPFMHRHCGNILSWMFEPAHTTAGNSSGKSLHLLTMFLKRSWRHSNISWWHLFAAAQTGLSFWLK